MLRRSPVLNGVVCRDSELELPVLVRLLIRRVEDWLLCEGKRHGHVPSLIVVITFHTLYRLRPRHARTGPSLSAKPPSCAPASQLSLISCELRFFARPVDGVHRLLLHGEGPAICRPCAGQVAPSLLLTWPVHWLQCHGLLRGPLPPALCLGPFFADYVAGIPQGGWVRFQQRKTRQALFGVLSPLGRLVESERQEKLEDTVTLSWQELRASDLSGRARAFQSMVGGGMDVSQAVAVAGLMVED